MIHVERQEGENFKSMLYRFKKLQHKSQFWSDINKNKYYIKPTTKRRAEKKQRDFKIMLINKRK
jgi:ribosomal protein S21